MDISLLIQSKWPNESPSGLPVPSAETLKNLKRLENDSTLVRAREYEGGKSVWEASHDLASYLHSERDTVYKHQSNIHFNILELGCGHGIPSITFCQSVEFNKLVLQDLNRDVLINCTIPNAVDILGPQRILDGDVEFVAADWSDFGSQNSISENLTSKFQLIIASECIYRPEVYTDFMSIIENWLDQNGKVLIATKRFYFGLGGGTFEFLDFLRSNYKMEQKDDKIDPIDQIIHNCLFDVKIVSSTSDGKSNIRDIIEVKWHQQS